MEPDLNVERQRAHALLDMLPARRKSKQTGNSKTREAPTKEVSGGAS